MTSIHQFVFYQSTNMAKNFVSPKRLFKNILILKKKKKEKKILPPHFKVLTSNTWTMRPSLTRSKWNMDENCSLKFHLSYVDMPQDCSWKFLHAHCTHHIIFITKFVLLIKIPPLYEVIHLIEDSLSMEEFLKYFF